MVDSPKPINWLYLSGKFSQYKYGVVIVVIFVLVITVLTSVYFMVGRKQTLVTNKTTTEVNLFLVPSTDTIGIGETKKYTLNANFSGGSSSFKLGYFKAVLKFPVSYIQIPKGEYVNTSQSGFDKIIRVDGPLAANESGEITIELASEFSSNASVTDKPIRIAEITMSGKTKTESPQEIVISYVQIKSSSNTQVPVHISNLSFSIK